MIAYITNEFLKQILHTFALYCDNPSPYGKKSLLAIICCNVAETVCGNIAATCQISYAN